jgi:hypothetical protein
MLPTHTTTNGRVHHVREIWDGSKYGVGLEV